MVYTSETPRLGFWKLGEEINAGESTRSCSSARADGNTVTATAPDSSAGAQGPRLPGSLEEAQDRGWTTSVDEPFVCLDVSHLAAVCAFPGCAACRLIGRVGRIRGIGINVDSDILLLLPFALFLAHLTSVLVFEQA